MSKAYDRIESRFLREMVKKLGFKGNWIDKVMECVESMKYKIIVNGLCSKEIILERGLREGNPIYPYLFLLCQKWFSMNLIEIKRSKRIEGIKLAHCLERLNNLFFADECLLFIKAELSHIIYLKEIPRRYEDVAGQKVNYAKFEFSDNPNLDDHYLKLLENMLGMRMVEHHSQYLGLPLCLRKTREYHSVRLKIECTKDYMTGNI